MNKTKSKGGKRGVPLWVQRVGALLLVGLLVFSLTPSGRAFWNALYQSSGFRGPEDKALLRIHMLDVGKADAILLECEGAAALLDAGTYAHGDRVVDYLVRMGVDHLEYAIVSHPDSDHLGGMAQVVEELPVGEVIVSSWSEEQEGLQEWKLLTEAIAQRGVPVREVLPGDTISLGSAQLEALAPLDDYEDTNDSSLVLRLDCEGFSGLFCGDIESKAELDLVKSGFNLDVDFLKVPHHGSASSCSQRFLDAVTPKWAAISVGPDNNELPREETLVRLEEAGAQIYRTDTDGDLVFSWDGEQLSVWNEYHNPLLERRNAS